MPKTTGNKKSNKEITIGDLAVAINNLSVKMDSKFNEVDSRFNKIDKRFVKIDNQFNKVNDRFKEQEVKLGKMMDEKIEDLAVMVNKSFESVEIRLEKTATKDDLNLLRQDMDGKFDKVNNSIEKMGIKLDNLADVMYVDHRQRIINLENRMQKMESSR